jgi:DNA polymerase
MESSIDQQLRAYVTYLRDMGIYDLYRRDAPVIALPEAIKARLHAQSARSVANKAAAQPARPIDRQQTTRPSVIQRPPLHASNLPAPQPQKGAAAAAPVYFTGDTGAAAQPLPPELSAPMPKPKSFDELAPPAASIPPADRAVALEAVRAEIGDCTRCPLAYAGRHTIVFADGDPNARLMFVGEGPGADEDASGLPFVGKAGQLLNNMIAAMGVTREQVYIANIVKCRPPANRTPEFVEAATCSQFLLRQIDIVHPQVIVALGATAATYLLGVRQSLSSLRGRWHTARGAKVAVTYHPAFLLRDPRQKAEAWKDLQMVMAELGLKAPARKN